MTWQSLQHTRFLQLSLSCPHTWLQRLSALHRHIKWRLWGKLTSTLSLRGQLTQPKITSAPSFLLQFPSIPAPIAVSSVIAWQSRCEGPWHQFLLLKGGEILVFSLHTRVDRVLKAKVGLLTERYGWITMKRCVCFESHNIPNHRTFLFTKKLTKKNLYLTNGTWHFAITNNLALVTKATWCNLWTRWTTINNFESVGRLQIYHSLSGILSNLQ